MSTASGGVTASIDGPLPSTGQRLRSGLRTWNRGISLRAWLVTILLTLLIVALGITGWTAQLVLRNYLTGQVDDQLRITVATAAGGDLLQNLREQQDQTAHFPTTFWVKITIDGDPSATRLYTPSGHTAADAVTPNLPTLTNAEAAAWRGRPYTTSSTGAGPRWRAISIPVTAFPVSAPGTLTVAQPLDQVEDAVHWLRWSLLALGAAVSLLCAGLGWFAIRRAFAPLVEVEQTAAAIAAGDLSRRIPDRPETTEVGRLTSSLNGMLTQIETAFRAREASQARTRRFAADASHELRTPLAAIRGFAELYRQGAVAENDVARTMRRIEDEARRMGSLVEDLLLLARLDEERPSRHDPVDLTVLAADAVHDARGLDAARTVHLVGLTPAAGPHPTLVTGDEDRLRQVVANLVGNAVRHTPAGSPIEVAVGTGPSAAPSPHESRPGTPQATCAILEIRDHGAGLTPEQAERVFERFYRVDASRRRGTGGGSGLGLSIVAAVVAAHQGRVAVMPTPGGGATFRVELPPSEPQPPAPGANRRPKAPEQADGLPAHATTDEPQPVLPTPRELPG